MNDQDYIRKAVELADWFTCDELIYARVASLSNNYQRFIDALVAQLVRQVDSTTNCAVYMNFAQTKIERVPNPGGKIVSDCEGPDRTMNTIKAIVDSGVLETADSPKP